MSNRSESRCTQWWPGQAPSYKIGQRLWEQLRNDYVGDGGSEKVRQFHTRALSLGSLPMSTLRHALLGQE